MNLQSQIMSQEIVIKSAFLDCNVTGNLSNSLLCLYNFGFKVLDSACIVFTLFHMLIMETPAGLGCMVTLLTISTVITDIVCYVSKYAVTRMCICVSSAAYKDELQRVLHQLHL